LPDPLDVASRDRALPFGVLLRLLAMGIHLEGFLPPASDNNARQCPRRTSRVAHVGDVRAADADPGHGDRGAAGPVRAQGACARLDRQA
jgi:hypothetical protein